MPPTYLIIGNGPAGFEAAKSIRQRDGHGKIIILSSERHGFYSRPGLAYLLTGEVPESQLFSHSTADYRQLGIILINRRVTSINPSTRNVQLENGDLLNYDALLLATGARSVLPDLPGIDHQGVVTFDSLDDTKRILKLSRRAKQAVVIGGGITALELVEGLVKRKIKVHYFLRSDRFWSKVFERNESRLVEHRLSSLGVKIHYRTHIKQIIERRGRVAAVEDQRGERIPCQMVGVAIGVQPRSELAQNAGLHTQRGIIVDEYLRTSDPYIFAAGDVAEIYVPEIDSYNLHSLWPIARETGEIAGSNMAGDRVAFRSTVASNATLLAGIPVTIIGSVGSGEIDDDTVCIVRGDSESWQTRLDAFAVEAKCQNSHLRLMVGRTQLLGAVLIGDQHLSAPLQALIESRINILPIRAQLLESTTDVPALLKAYWERCRSHKRAG